MAKMFVFEKVADNKHFELSLFGNIFDPAIIFKSYSI